LDYDAFGLVTQEDCDDAYEAAMKKVRQAGLKCTASAVKWGIIGEVIFGGTGIIGGAIVGGLPGAGIGLVIGTGLDVIVDWCHIHHCQKEVDKMKQDADKSHEDCLKQVN
jgi:hypothetical protein